MEDNERATPDALALLRALGSETRVPDGVSERVAARLSATLLLVNPTPGAPLAAPSPVVAPPRVSGFAPTRATWLTQAAAGKLLLFAVAGALGAGAHALLTPERVRVVYIKEPAAALPPSEPRVEMSSSVVPAPSSAPREPVSAAQSIPVKAPGAPSLDTSLLRRERTLLDAARKNLMNGDSQAALAKLSQHTREFPRGSLQAEREALRVNALVASGAYVEARSAAAAFQRAHPQSFLAPSVDAALAAIPE